MQQLLFNSMLAKLFKNSELLEAVSGLMHAQYQNILQCSPFSRAVWFTIITFGAQKYGFKIGQYWHLLYISHQDYI